jgi:hypothetical protein
MSDSSLSWECDLLGFLAGSNCTWHFGKEIWLEGKCIQHIECAMLILREYLRHYENSCLKGSSMIRSLNLKSGQPQLHCAV